MITSIEWTRLVELGRHARKPSPHGSVFIRDKKCLQPLKARPLALELSASLRERAQPHGVQPDETGRVAMVVGDVAFFESHEFLIVERIRAFAADHAHPAFVEFYRHGP